MPYLSKYKRPPNGGLLYLESDSYLRVTVPPASSTTFNIPSTIGVKYFASTPTWCFILKIEGMVSDAFGNANG